MDKKELKRVVIYTDGACSGNPGPGGWAATLQYNEHRKEISGYEESATNNRMELLAVIQAIKALKMPCRLLIHSDSAYVVNAFKLNWIGNWVRNGWKASKGQSVINQDLWKELITLIKIHEYEFIKVKGHSNSVENNRCNELAKNAIINKEGIGC